MRTLPRGAHLFDASGRVFGDALAPAVSVYRENGAAFLQNSERLRVDQWTKFDSGSREGAAPTDLGEGSGVRFSLTGGWSTTNPATGVWYVDPNPIRDVTGRKLAGLDQFVYMLHAVERAAPDLTSDIIFGVGLLTEAQASGATWDAVAGGWQWSGSTRAGRKASVADGTGSFVTAGTGNGSTRIVQVPIHRMGQGTSRIGVGFGYVLGSTGAILNITHGLSSAAASMAVGDPTALYRGFYMARLAATDTTTRTFDLDLYAHPGIASILD